MSWEDINDKLRNFKYGSSQYFAFTTFYGFPVPKILAIYFTHTRTK